MRRCVYSPSKTVEESCGPLADGVELTIVTHGQFGLGDLVEYAAEEVGPCSLLVSSWSMGHGDVKRFSSMLKAAVITDILVVCDRGLPARHPKYAADIESAFGLDRVRVSRLKANFAVVRGSFDVVVRGSSGFARSRGVDLYDLDCSADMASFISGSVEQLTGGLPHGWATTPEVDAALRPVKAVGPRPVKFDASRLRF